MTNQNQDKVRSAMQTQNNSNQLSQIDQRSGNVLALFKQYEGSLKSALPAHLTPGRLIRVMATECQKNPKLLKCTDISLCGAMIQAGQLGLEPGDGLGLCYLIPYGNVCELQMGYRGLIALAWNSDQISMIDSEVVYMNDKFTCKKGLNPVLDHEPVEKERGEIRGVWAMFKTVNGGSGFIYLTKDDVEKKHRAKSKSPNSPAWRDNYGAMMQKSAIKEMEKFMPKSIEKGRALATAVNLDNAANVGGRQEINLFDNDGNPRVNPITTEFTAEPESKDLTVNEKIEKRIQDAKGQGDCAETANEIERALEAKEITKKEAGELLKNNTEAATAFPDE